MTIPEPQSIISLASDVSLALQRVVYRIYYLEDLEIIFIPPQTRLPSILQPSYASTNLDHLCNFMCLVRPWQYLALSESPFLRRLHLESVAAKYEELVRFLGSHCETIRDLALISIEWMDDSSLFAWIRDIRSVADSLETVKFSGIHEEITQRRSIDMDESLTEYFSFAEGEVDHEHLQTVGDGLGEICLSRTPIDSELRMAILA